MKLRQRVTTAIVLTLLGAFVLLIVETELHFVTRLPNEYGETNGNHYPVLQRRFLNREETSRVASENQNVQNNVILDSKDFIKNKTSTSSTTDKQRETAQVRENFSDLFKYTVFSPDYKQYLRPPDFVLEDENPTLGDILKIPIRRNMSSWEKFHLQISKYSLYPEDMRVVEELLRDIATQNIVGIEQHPTGTQIKLVLTFENGGQALFKPMRFPRDHETLPNHFYFTDFERHHSEIACFHLDKLLGFRHAPPVVGRILNITSEIYAFADKDLLKTFFVSPAGNLCFHGQCTYYCDTSHAICGSPDTLEGSLAVFLPPKDLLSRHPVRSPYRRSYNKRRKAPWEINDSHCSIVKEKRPFNSGRRLYDLIDLSVFDFLSGNMDRHHIEEILAFGNDSSLIHWDHGRGFGRAYHDEISILQPLLQCCVIRLSTFNRIYAFHNGPIRLSELMRHSMASDPVAPVLTDAHLAALDRRIGLILQAIRKCLFYNKAEDVFLDDL